MTSQKRKSHGSDLTTSKAWSERDSLHGHAVKGAPTGRPSGSIQLPSESAAEEASRKDPNSLYTHCKVCPKTSHCCYRAPTIVVLPQEAALLIKKTRRPDLLINEGNSLFTIKKSPGEPCPFLTQERLCGVYDIRPIDCRSWPLTLSRTANPKDQLLEDLDCPPIRQGALSSKFEKAAQSILSKIPAKYREAFVHLVHRDFKNHKIPVKPHIPGESR